MSTSKTNPSRAGKGKEYGEKVKKANQQAQIPKTTMVPQTEWQSDATLDLRGDLAEALEVNLVKAFEAIQKAGQALQQIIGLNIQAGKVKLNYLWNNGEIPTEEEVETWKKQIQFLQEERQKQIDALQNKVNSAVKANETGLVTVGGQPLTEETLEEEKAGIIV